MKKLIISLVVLIAGAILMQGFQCSSREMTTAKVAVKKQQWDKASDALEREIAKNPKNAEALLLQSEVKMKLGDIKSAVKLANEAEKHAQKPEIAGRIPAYKYTLWTEIKNKGISAYSKYEQSKNLDDVRKALEYYNLCIELRPKNEDFYRGEGIFLEKLGDTTQAIESYQKAVDIMKEANKIAASKSIFLNMQRSEAISKLGAPIGSRAFPAGADSAYIDIFKIDGNGFYLFSFSAEEGPAVKGWRYNPPAHWHPNEKAHFTELSLQPYFNLTDIYYQREQYDKALEYITEATRIDPNDKQASRFMLNIYAAAGKEDEALESVENLVQNDPNNARLWEQYGNILFEMDLYKEAAEKYNQAIAIDPELITSHRNVAITYENIVRRIMEVQDSLAQADPKYERDFSQFKGYLQKAADHLEKCKKDREFEDDLSLYAELTTIYLQLEDNRFEENIRALENRENIAKDKQQYYGILCRAFTQIGIAFPDDPKWVEKRREACAKLK